MLSDPPIDIGVRIPALFAVPPPCPIVSFVEKSFDIVSFHCKRAGDCNYAIGA